MVQQSNSRGNANERKMLDHSETGVSPISVYVTGRATPCAMIYDSDDVFTTRSRYRIQGDFVGSLPKHTSQNQYLSLPLALSYEEASFGVREGFFKLVDDRPECYQGGAEGVEGFFERRREDVEEQVEVVLEGQRKEREKRGVKRKRDGKHAGGDAGNGHAAKATKPMANGRRAEGGEPPKKLRRVGFFGWLGKTLRGVAGMVAATWTRRDTAAIDKAPAQKVETPEEDKEHLLGVRQRRQARQTALIVTAMASRKDERRGKERRVGLDALVPPPGMSADKLRRRQLVFAGLHRKGYSVSCGAKFGADFLAYAGDPVLFHAAVAVVAVGEDEDMDGLDVVAVGRLGNSTRKRMVFAYVVEGAQLATPSDEPPPSSQVSRFATDAVMVYLDHNAFMAELSKLYTANKTSGSVWVTMKRVERPISTGRNKLQIDGPACLVHASDGSRKIACTVPAGEHVRFHMDLFTVIKANTENLVKPKRVKRKMDKGS